MITFIATAYKEKEQCFSFISSLLCQTDSRWKCIIYCDEYNSYIEYACSIFNDSRIEIVYNEIASGFWGHNNRKYALDNLVDSEFIIQTSIQDYFIPITVNEILSVKDQYDFIYYESLHNHKNYDILNCIPIVNNIDWGNFAIRTNIAKKVGIHNIESSTCDGLFVESCMKYPFLRVHKINKILTIHN